MSDPLVTWAVVYAGNSGSAGRLGGFDRAFRGVFRAAVVVLRRLLSAECRGLRRERTRHGRLEICITCNGGEIMAVLSWDNGTIGTIRVYLMYAVEAAYSRL